MERNREGRKNNDKNKNSESRNLIFWNIVGLASNDCQVWHFLEGKNFISLIETWMEGSSTKYWETKYSKDFTWKLFEAVREKRKGRAKGRILIGVRKSWVEEKDVEINRVKNI